jgi:hypothetical protein
MSDAIVFDFDMYFNRMHGGPCPVCHCYGQLKRHFGFLTPNSRTLIHSDESGQLRMCWFADPDIVVTTVDGTWRWIHRSEHP